MPATDTPRSSRQVREEIERLAIEGKGLVDRCQAERRQLNDAESARFDQITINEIPSLQREETAAKQWEEAQLQLAGAGQGGPANMYHHNFNQHNQGLQRLLDGQKPLAQRTMGRVSSLRAFHTEQAAYDAGQWLKAIVARTHHNSIDNAAEEHCKSKGLEIFNVGTEGSGPAGGYLVPAPLVATIIEVREQVGVARQVCNVMPATGDTLTVPKRAGGLTVYAPGEGNAITDSDKSWSAVSLVVKKRAVASYISQELSDDALINIVDNVFVEMAFALAQQEDKELINGDGSGATYFGVRGLLNRLGSAGVSTAATGHDTWGELDIADMAACTAKLPDRFFPYGPSWIASHSFFNNVMARIAYSAGGVTMAEVMSGSPNVRSFMGYPVYLTAQMPTSTAAATVCALFGAFSQAVILADRSGIRVARSDDFKFLEDKITLKATSRYDFNVHEPGDASAAGAYVGLKTAA
jgi:HK97 family phage major capsid protein